MGLNVHIKHEGEIDELLDRYPCFSFIKNRNLPTDSIHRWTTNDSYWGYVDKTTYNMQIMFIGKTGYGKSTTLNRLVGKSAFETSDVSVCTKDLYTAMYRINPSIPTFIMFSDLPGVGESNYADDHYYVWYKDMLEKTDVVVYILRADQRDFAVDEMIFSNLLKNSNDKNKVFIAINYADKVEPISRKIGLSQEQLNSLSRKVREVSCIFNVPQSDVIYYSAADNINMNLLTEKIAQKLMRNL
ncbi:MAG: GTP-binding protein [Clostridia bacterium]|nr:GTP-binding protein [Clostridia bacterium]